MIKIHFIYKINCWMQYATWVQSSLKTNYLLNYAQLMPRKGEFHVTFALIKERQKTLSAPPAVVINLSDRTVIRSPTQIVAVLFRVFWPWVSARENFWNIRECCDSVSLRLGSSEISQSCILCDYDSRDISSVITFISSQLDIRKVQLLISST